MSRAVSRHITVVKIDSYQTECEDVAAILTGIECKYMSFCLVFSILPNFYEIKTNFRGRVEKTDPHSADYPLTPLRGLLYGLLRGLLYGLVRGLPCGLP